MPKEPENHAISPRDKPSPRSNDRSRQRDDRSAPHNDRSTRDDDRSTRHVDRSFCRVDRCTKQEDRHSACVIRHSSQARPIAHAGLRAGASTNAESRMPNAAPSPLTPRVPLSSAMRTSLTPEEWAALTGRLQDPLPPAPPSPRGQNITPSAPRRIRDNTHPPPTRACRSRTWCRHHAAVA